MMFIDQSYNPRFHTRLEQVLKARLFFLLFCFSAWVFPTWHPLRLDLPVWLGSILFIFMLAHMVFFYRVSIQKGPIYFFISLCFDLIGLIFLIDQNGGLSSLLLAYIPIYAGFFAFLFHSLWMQIPPFLILPVVSFAGMHHKAAIWILIFYYFLMSICVYCVFSTMRVERIQNKKLSKLQKKLQSLAIIEERQRISREMHDGVGAILSGLILQCEYILSHFSLSKDLQKEIEEIQNLCQSAISDVRRSLGLLRDEFDLVPHFKQVCEQFSHKYGILAKTQIVGEPKALSCEQQHTLFRILGEALHNIVKHANATQVDIELSFLQNQTFLTIKDDGIGMDLNQKKVHRYGLKGMKERAKSCNGDIHIESKEGDGTRIVLELP